MKVFYAVFVPESDVAACLDAIRFVCEPSVSTRCHITVRGPYKQRFNISRLSRTASNVSVRVRGVGSFDGPSQNTIFLRCNSSELKLVWRKPDYGYAPHITLYDGQSRHFAWQLKKILRNRDIDFSFRTRGLEPLVSNGPQRSMERRWDIAEARFRSLLGNSIAWASIENMRAGDRLELVSRLCSQLPTSSGG